MKHFTTYRLPTYQSQVPTQLRYLVVANKVRARQSGEEGTYNFWFTVHTAAAQKWSLPRP